MEKVVYVCYSYQENQNEKYITCVTSDRKAASKWTIIMNYKNYKALKKLRLEVNNNDYLFYKNEILNNHYAFEEILFKD